MGFTAVEEVTLPARFLTTVAHLIAILTVALDARPLASNILLTQSVDVADYSGPDLDAVTRQLSDAAYAGVACLAVELLGLFLGFSLFLRAHNCFYIMTHFAGAILTGLLYTQVWSAGLMVAFVVVFNCLPAALELMTVIRVIRSGFLSS